MNILWSEIFWKVLLGSQIVVRDQSLRLKKFSIKPLQQKRLNFHLFLQIYNDVIPQKITINA